jgi:hypothetical protein
MFSLYHNTTGSGNNAYGYQALNTNTIGTNNLGLGYEADVISNNLTNATSIGGFSQVGASNTIALGYSAAQGDNNTVGIGTSFAPNELTVSPNTYGTNGSSGGATTIEQDNGTHTCPGNAGFNIIGSGTAFTPAMTGGTIYYSDGTTAIVTYVSATSLTSSVSKCVAASSTYNIVAGGFNVSSTGTAFLQPTIDSTSAFQIQSAGGTSQLNVDTVNQNVTLGVNTALYVTGMRINDTPTTNLVSNPSFETGLSGWNSYWSGAKTQVTGGLFGTYAMQVVTVGANGLNDGASFALPGGLATGNYSLSFYLKSPAQTPVIRLTLEGNLTATGGTTCTASGSWQRCTTTFNVSTWGTGGSANSKIDIIENTDNATAQTYLVDGVQFEATANPTTYTDTTRAAGSALFNGTNSTTAFQVQNASDITALNVDTTNLITTLRAGTDAGILGAEMMTGSESFPTGSGWTGSGTGGAASAVHAASGGTTAESPTPALSILNATGYDVTYTISCTTGCTTGPAAGSTLVVTMGGLTIASYTFEGTSNSNFTDTVPVFTTGTANLAFTPSTTFNGTVSGVSVKQITGNNNPALVIKNVSGATSLEVRASSGTGNTFIGTQAGLYNVSGNFNTALGNFALQSNASGNNNVAIGNNALQENVSGSFNAALGLNALANNTSGYNNVAVGQNALLGNTVGYNNTAVGEGALNSNTIGIKNSAFGYGSLINNTTGWSNTAIGKEALLGNTTGVQNTALGVQALYTNTTGIQNTALGDGADVLTGNLTQATAIGFNAQVGASNNIILGYSAANGINNNVGIGASYAPNSLTVSPHTYNTGTITQSGFTITGSGTTFQTVANTGLLYYADGSTATITYISPTQLTSSVSKTISTGQTYNIVWGGFNVTANGTAYLQPTGADSTTAFQVLNEFDTTAVLNADTVNARLGINTTAPDSALSIKNTDGSPAVLNAYVATATGLDYGVLQVSNSGGLTNPSARSLALQPNGGDVCIGTTTDTGGHCASTLDVGGANSTSAFQVQNVGGTSLLNVDTSGNILNLGITGSTATASTVNLATSTGAAQTVNAGSTNTGSSVHLTAGGLTQTLTNTSDIIQSTTNSTTAFQIQSAAGTSVLNYDTTLAVLSTKPFGATYVGGADVSGSTNSGTGSSIVHQVTVSGRYEYVTTTGNATACSQTAGSAIGCELQVYDVSNPATPTYVGGADSSGTTNSGTGSSSFNSITVSGHYIYVGTGFGGGNTCSQTAGSATGCEFQIYDISNPSAPTYVGGANASGSTNSGNGNNFVNAVYVSGRYAYVGYGGNATACSQTAGSAIGCELQVYDVSNPATPIYLGGADTSGTTNGGTGSSNLESIVVQGRYAYIGIGGNATACSQTAGSAIGCEFQVYDVSNPSAPAYIGGADISGSTNSGTGNNFINNNSLAVQGRYAYIGTGGNATACSQTAGSAIGCEFQVYDVSNPATPTYDGGADASGSTNAGTGNKNIQALTASGRYIYVTTANNATACSQTAGSAIGCEFQVYDVSTPATPTYDGGADASGSTNSGTGADSLFSISVSGSYAYVGKSSNATACSQTPGSAIGCEMQSYNIGGIQANTVQADSLEGGSLQVDNSAAVSNQLSVGGSLSVGQSLEIQGNVGVSGSVLFKNTTNSTTAFQVQNLAGNNLLAVDTTTAAPIVNVGVTGATALASTVNIATSTGAAQTINIGAVGSGVANSGTTVSIQGGTGASAISIGTSAAVNQVAIGSTNGASTVTIASGTGNLALTTNGTGQLNIGNNAVAQTINIGNSTGATSVNIQCGTGATACQLGTNAIAHTTIVGTTTGAGATTIQAGTGNLTLTGPVSTTTTGGIIIGAVDGSQTNLVLDNANTFTDVATSCSNTVNLGAMYYNDINPSAPSSVTSTGSIRVCEGFASTGTSATAAWTDLPSTADLGAIMFGVVPDSGNATNAQDLPALITAGQTGPCKVSAASATTVNIEPCVAYTGGRRIIVNQQTFTVIVTSGWTGICLDGTSDAPNNHNAAAENNAVPGTFSTTAPVLCLAQVAVNGTKITQVYDTRTFTTTTKEFVTATSTVLRLGMLVSVNGSGVTPLGTGTVGTVGSIRGVVVGTTGSLGSTTPNSVIATAGPAFAKVTDAGATAGQFLENSAGTGGYGTTSATGSAAIYGNAGFARNTTVATATCSTTPNAANCIGSTYVLLDIR